MTLEPNVIVLYVNDVIKSSQFYQDLLGIKTEEASPTFHSFTLSNGMSLALKANHSVMPPIDAKSGNGELAFTLDSYQKVDEIYTAWQTKHLEILQPPTQVPFGYTFVALDLDGHRLRVASIGNH